MIFLLLALLLLAPQDVKHDTPAVPVKGSIRVDVDLTTVDVSVLTVDGRFVTGLGPGHFRVFEDKIEQEIIYFSSDDAPVSVGIVFDASASMKNKMGGSKQALMEFVKTSNPLDEFFLVSFSDTAQLVEPFTSSPEELETKLLTVEGQGQTAMFDGLYLALAELRMAKYGRRALIIISDGGENHSRYSYSYIKSASRECSCQIYAIGLFNPVSDRPTVEERYGPIVLEDIVEATGGRGFSVKEPKDFTDIARAISLTLRNEYVLGYHSSNHARDGRWRKIKVKTQGIPKKIPPLVLRVKSGYYGATQ